jgi:hypothetical protein
MSELYRPHQAKLRDLPRHGMINICNAMKINGDTLLYSIMPNNLDAIVPQIDPI